MNHAPFRYLDVKIVGLMELNKKEGAR